MSSISAFSSLSTASAPTPSTYFYIMSYILYFISYQQLKKQYLTYLISTQYIIIQIMVSYNVLEIGPKQEGKLDPSTYGLFILAK